MAPNDLQDLLDKQALLDLATQYCRAIDRRDYVLLRSLYLEGAREDRGAIFCGSSDEFVDWVAKDSVNYELTVHRLFNSQFELDGERAEGEIYAEAYHRTAGDSPQEVIAGGRYLDRYEKRNGRWGFVFRTSTLDRCEVKPLDPEAYTQFVAGSVAGIGSADDLSYKVLSMFGRKPL